MHRRGFILGSLSKKTMALLSKQVTIPMLLFTKLVNCVPDSNDPNKCFTITDEISQGLWIVLIWPIFVVACGFFIGYIMAVVTRSQQKRVVIGAIAFGNSTSLPYTLSTAIVASVPPSSNTTFTDPIVIMGLYMILYPIFLWGIGSFLFPPSVDNKEEISEAVVTVEEGIDDSASLNQPEATASIKKKVTLILTKLLPPPVIAALLGITVTAIPQLRGLLVNLQPNDESVAVPFGWLFNGINIIGGAAIPINMVILGVNLSMAADEFTFFKRCRRKSRISDETSIEINSRGEQEDPEEGENKSKMSYWTMFAVVFGKMVLMPIVGILSVFGLKQVMVVPSDIAATMYMVMMLVFLCPTGTLLHYVDTLLTYCFTYHFCASQTLKLKLTPRRLSLSLSLSLSFSEQYYGVGRAIEWRGI
jgi:predicted permease